MIWLQKLYGYESIYLAGTKRRKMSGKISVWEHFEKVENGKVKCTHCEKVFGHSHSSQKYHIAKSCKKIPGEQRKVFNGDCVAGEKRKKPHSQTLLDPHLRNELDWRKKAALAFVFCRIAYQVSDNWKLLFGQKYCVLREIPKRSISRENFSHGQIVFATFPKKPQSLAPFIDLFSVFHLSQAKEDVEGNVIFFTWHSKLFCGVFVDTGSRQSILQRSFCLCCQPLKHTRRCPLAVRHHKKECVSSNKG